MTCENCTHEDYSHLWKADEHGNKPCTIRKMMDDVEYKCACNNLESDGWVEGELA